MMGIDTYSWQKLILLKNMPEWSQIIEDIIQQVNWFVTTEGKKEFSYRFPDYQYILDQITILPVLGTSIYEIHLQKFDSTDASLLEYNEIKGYRIITEDRLMLALGVSNKENIVPLLDFLFELFIKYETFSKNEIYGLIRIFRFWRNISKNKEKLLKKRLHMGKIVRT